MIKERDFVDLGLALSGACQDLGRGIDGRGTDDQPSQLVLDAIEQLTMWVKPPTHTPYGLLTNLSIAGSWLGSRVT